ncbi:ABC transporter permease [Isosphaeraceae bacterium EP7]
MPRDHSLRELYFSRLREFFRQPARIFWVYGFPTVLAIGLGLAFRSKPAELVQLDLVENAGTPEILAKLEEYKAKRQAGTPDLLIKVLGVDQAKSRLETGKTPLIVIPGTSTNAPLTYRYDPTRPEALTARAAVDNVLQVGFGRLDALKTADEAVQEPGSRYIDFLIPGLIGLNTMGGGLWGIGFLLVNFRVAKLLKLFRATPMPRRNFLLALIGARLTFLIPDLGVLLVLGTWMFGMPIRGSFWLLILVDVVGAMAFAGIGLLVASRATTTETVSGLMNLVMLPMWLFSGVFFSSERFPASAQPFIQALPLTQIISALRMVMLEGAGFVAVAPALAILMAWTIGTFLIALKIFRWN